MKKNLLKIIVNNCNTYIFPAVCLSCHENIASKGLHGLCQRCSTQFIAINKPSCKICGGNLTTVLEACSTCLKISPLWNNGYVIFKYQTRVKKAIHELKYANKTYWFPFFAYSFIDLFDKNMIMSSFDIITWIPLHPLKYLLRGYNQAELFATFLSSNINMPCINLLKRVEFNCSQTSLTFSEREKNVKDIFSIKSRQKNMMYGKRILLVDDVITTGATLNEASKVLLNSKVASVSILTLAKR